jgi:hypothetical protein
VCGLVLVDPTQEGFVQWNEARDSKHEEWNMAEWPQIKASLDEARGSNLPLGIVVVLITGMGPPTLPGFMSEKEKQDYRTDHQMWLKFHQQWVDSIPGAQHMITEKTGHGIPFLEPELVIEAVSNVVVQVRRSGTAATKHSPNALP